ncbi:unnamed protein product [Protopolystoma xenopodis]|uniref:Uncharacterized protein n=1 Tax=Protopolystoma xenopodis TaxID=117903 RepID=A0A448WAY5_9PLAT|nr:unnamed protein product [Protopolystoma xenopodis]
MSLTLGLVQNGSRSWTGSMVDLNETAYRRSELSSGPMLLRRRLARYASAPASASGSVASRPVKHADLEADGDGEESVASGTWRPIPPVDYAWQSSESDGDGDDDDDDDDEEEGAGSRATRPASPHWYWLDGLREYVGLSGLLRRKLASAFAHRDPTPRSGQVAPDPAPHSAVRGSPDSSLFVSGPTDGPETGEPDSPEAGESGRARPVSGLRPRRRHCLSDGDLSTAIDTKAALDWASAKQPPKPLGSPSSLAEDDDSFDEPGSPDAFLACAETLATVEAVETVETAAPAVLATPVLGGEEATGADSLLDSSLDEPASFEALESSSPETSDASLGLAEPRKKLRKTVTFADELGKLLTEVRVFNDPLSRSCLACKPSNSRFCFLLYTHLPSLLIPSSSLVMTLQFEGIRQSHRPTLLPF